MSYRSIKRVLGETSLERKCRFLFGACLLLLITASFWLYGKRTNKIIDEQNRSTGYLLTLQEMQAAHCRSNPKTVETNGSENWWQRMLSEMFSETEHTLRGQVHSAQPSAAALTEAIADNIARQGSVLEKQPSTDFLKNKPRKSTMADTDEFREWMSDDGQHLLLLPSDPRK